MKKFSNSCGVPSFTGAGPIGGALFENNDADAIPLVLMQSRRKLISKRDRTDVLRIQMEACAEVLTHQDGAVTRQHELFITILCRGITFDYDRASDQ